MKALLCAAALTVLVGSALPANAEYISYRHNNAGIHAAQLRLKQLGYPVGKLDGVNGMRTRNALAAFQRDQGLMVSGNYDYYTQAALFPVYNTAYHAPQMPMAAQPVYRQQAYQVAYSVPLTQYNNTVYARPTYVQPTYAQPIAYAAQLPAVNRPVATVYAIPEAVRYGNYYTPAGSQITTVMPLPQ